MENNHQYNTEGRDRIRISLSLAFIGTYTAFFISVIGFNPINSSNSSLLGELIEVVMVIYGLIISLLLLFYIMAVMQEYQKKETTDQIEFIGGYKVDTKKFLQLKEVLYQKGTNQALLATFLIPLSYLLIFALPKNLPEETSWILLPVALAGLFFITILIIKTILFLFGIKMEK